MGSLFAFLFRLRAFGLFLILEALSIFLVVKGNTYQRMLYFNTSNEVVAKAYENTDKVKDYFYLAKVNNDLASENARLQSILGKYRTQLENLKIDSLKQDTLIQYKYLVAKVINNSVDRVNNYLTLNKGTADSVLAGMAVVSPTGVVGRVRNVSDHYATVTSLLHTKMVISAEIGRTRAFGTIKWAGKDTRTANLLYIARHLKPKIGDTVVTSSLSSVFPQGVRIGRISKVTIRDDDTFYNIEVQLSANFGALEYVYIVRNRLQAEQDTLEAKLPQ